MKEIKSGCEITKGHRILIGLLWILFLWWLNFLFFAPFIWVKYWFVEILLLVFLWIFLFLLVKNTRYVYLIKNGFLEIKTPRKKSHYKIPLTDIEKVWIYKNIPFYFRIGIKYDFLNKILFLCGYCNRGIILKLKKFEHQIVICPRKFDEFYKILQEAIYK